MNAPRLEIDGLKWFERWEAMLRGYNPHRDDFFRMMGDWIEAVGPKKAHILDLGCGPGSLSVYLQERFPETQLTAVDFDPVLLEIGRQVVIERNLRIRFERGDVREKAWWDSRDDSYDAVVSSIALHWLSPSHLRELYKRIHCGLKPGGWFLNSDHMALPDSRVSEFSAGIQQMRRERAFEKSGGERWSAFWETLQQDCPQVDLASLRNEAAYWEGSEEGAPLEFHLGALNQSGFERAACIYQVLGDALVVARRSGCGLSHLRS